VACPPAILVNRGDERPAHKESDSPEIPRPTAPRSSRFSDGRTFQSCDRLRLLAGTGTHCLMGIGRCPEGSDLRRRPCAVLGGHFQGRLVYDPAIAQTSEWARLTPRRAHIERSNSEWAQSPTSDKVYEGRGTGLGRRRGVRWQRITPLALLFQRRRCFEATATRTSSLIISFARHQRPLHHNDPHSSRRPEQSRAALSASTLLHIAVVASSHTQRLPVEIRERPEHSASRYHGGFPPNSCA